MNLRGVLTAALAAILLGATARPVPLTVYSAPAVDRPAGADAIHPADSILPDGRISAPVGQAIFVGTTPLGVALSPDGRFAIIADANQRRTGLTPPASQPTLPIGYALAVVDTRAMTLADVFHDPAIAFTGGIAALRDPAEPSRTIVLAGDGYAGTVRVFDLDSEGHLSAETAAIKLPSAPGGHAYPSKIVVSANGRIAYVTDDLGNALVALDVASRSVLQSTPVGYFPSDVALTPARALVTNAGLSSYQQLPRPAPVPAFGAPALDPERSSSLSLVPLAAGEIAGAPAALPMDPAPDGRQIIGGAHPQAIAVRHDGRYAYVAMANVDRVAVVSLAGAPRVVNGLDLRLFVSAPYGTQPSAEALTPDGKRLYVALAGLNAVAVLDARNPLQLHRLGLLPTAWYPSALALSPNGHDLYVTAAKGVDGWGVLQKIDLRHTGLVKSTLDALRYARVAAAAKFNPVIPPLRSGKRSVAIDHVVWIEVGNQTYDAMLGDLTDGAGSPLGNGDTTLVSYGQRATPNLHALARTYAVADNFYASDIDLELSQLASLTGEPSLYTATTATTNSNRAPLISRGADPEDYARAGYAFNLFSNAGLSYRDYGALLDLSGLQNGQYTLDVPALAALDGAVDTNYLGDPVRTDDARRVQEFARDFGRYVNADQTPAFTYIWLPTPARVGGVTDADRALGSIVATISHTPHWSSTVIFVVPEGIDGGADHVNGLRSYALVVSPLAKRGYVGHAHLSAAGVLKTVEEIFALPPLSLGDLLATDLSDFFADAPTPETYDPQ